MAKVIISRAADELLQFLISILYEQKYFGFKEDAIAYVEAMYSFIQTLPAQTPKRCPIVS